MNLIKSLLLGIIITILPGTVHSMDRLKTAQVTDIMCGISTVLCGVGLVKGIHYAKQNYDAFMYNRRQLAQVYRDLDAAELSKQQLAESRQRIEFGRYALEATINNQDNGEAYSKKARSDIENMNKIDRVTVYQNANTAHITNLSARKIWHNDRINRRRLNAIAGITCALASCLGLWKSAQYMNLI